MNVVLLRGGRSVEYFECTNCREYVRKLSGYGLCSHCELQAKRLGLEPVGFDANGSEAVEIP